MDDKEYFVDTTGYMISSNSKYLLAILNSSLWTFMFMQVSSVIRGGFLRWKRQYMAPLPVKTLPSSDEGRSKTEVIESFVSYLLFLQDQPLAEPRDRLMAAYFEQIVNGLVYELYFPALLKRHGRELFAHVGELPSIEGKSEEAAMSLIRQVFQRMEDKGHPLRNNLFFLDSIPEIRIIEGKA